MLFFSTSLNAQNVELSFNPSSVTIDPGDTTTLSVLGENFTGVTGFSGTITWDPSTLNYLGVPPLTINLSGLTLNETMVASGILIFGWFDFGAGVMLDNMTPVFEVQFEGASSGMTTVQFSEMPAPTTIVQGITEYTPVSTGSLVTVTGTPPPPPPPGSNFAYDCDDFTDVAFYSSFDTVATGEQACLSIAVCNFNQITSFGFTLDFDEALLQFDSVTNFNLPQLSASNFGTTLADSGYVTVGWFEEMGNGVDIVDTSTIFDICFTAIGAGGSMDSLFINGEKTAFEAADTSLMQVPVESGPGYVVITGDTGPAVTLFATNETINAGGNVCVDIKCKNFVDMISMGFTMEWEEAIIDYDTILDPNNFFYGTIGGSTNTSAPLVDTGALTVTWLAQGNVPVTLMDSTTLFQVCYDAVGMPNEMSPVQFTSSLVSIDASQDDGMGMPVAVPLATVDGSVTIDPDSNPDGFVFNLSDTTGCEGDTVTIYYIATGFTNVATMAFQINWDTSQLSWIGIHSIILPPIFSPNT
ncbi:MAG: hypothetical protein HKN16_02915, partial [Saprospiraceae bacterium]|nr:hypothetical protein [Saprospiraceae bacterium]